jgi:hypothetical protein
MTPTGPLSINLSGLQFIIKVRTESNRRSKQFVFISFLIEAKTYIAICSFLEYGLGAHGKNVVVVARVVC